MQMWDSRWFLTASGGGDAPDLPGLPSPGMDVFQEVPGLGESAPETIQLYKQRASM